MTIITSLPALRELYAPVNPRSALKELIQLDMHATRFISLSPFVVISSYGADGRADTSPRGGEAGFVKVVDAGTLLIADSPGNNRLDSLGNIIETGRVGLLFMLPGVDETLRINGRAMLSIAPEHLQVFQGDRKPPKLVVVIGVEQAYLHCAKALMRSRLWSTQTQVARSVLPTMGKMIGDQMGVEFPPETQEQMVARYQQDI